MGAFQIILLGALALALIVAAVGDWRSRTIENWLNLGIALGAPLWWLANGESLWPDAAIHLLIATVAFGVFTGMFAIGAMGGGDVKLITALALWFPLVPFVTLLAAMAIVGGILTVGMVIRQNRLKLPGRPEVPYGIAIAAGGLWTVWGTVFRTIS
jgi:prepilin peptidase CpaA